MNDYRDDFLQIQNKPDKWSPVIRHRKAKLVKVGTWLFGLLPVYEIRYTEWEENDT